MATAVVSKPSKWLSHKTLKLISFPRLLSKPSSSSPSPSLCNNQEKLEQVFNHLDADKDGRISSQEISAYFASIGESVSDEEAGKVIKEFDMNGDNYLELGEFVRLMEAGGKEVDDDIRRAFEMFEVDKGCGYISPRGLQLMFNRLGYLKSQDECAIMIGVFDLDGNGVLDFNEFHHMMTTTAT